MSSPIVDTRLSYSSSTLLKNCSQKYFYHKVVGVAKDPDSSENEDAFNVGKCFHFVLEENGHTEDRLEELLDKGCKAFEVDSEKAMIHAMLLRYLQAHKKSGLTPVKCEFYIENKIFIGYIDVILTDDQGYWWIADLKTASRFSEITTARLTDDPQLNLYCSFADMLAKALNLDINKFMGARYRVTTKSSLTQKASESYNEFVIRTANNVKSYDIIIPKELMSPKETYKEFKKLHAKTMKLRSGKLKPEKNRSYCDSYFKPCEYWSQCHGGNTFTKCKELLVVNGSNNV